MGCRNCFNGCADTISDQCIKYTGPDVPELGIENGDSLSVVETAIINYLVPVLTGAGVKPIILDEVLCELVKSYLPSCTVCTGFTLNEILTAIVQSVCNLQSQIDVINGTLNILNGSYSLGCLTGVDPSSGTHSIVQAVINNLCSLNASFSAFVLSVQTNYINVSNIDSYIEAYINNNTPDTAANRMIPMSPVAYYGPLSNYPASGDSFDSSGVGHGYWNKVYICNGSSNPSAPDMRGRIPVGAVSGVPGGTLPTPVNPTSSPLNPNYSVGSTAGANGITLQIGELPPHNHPGSIATSVVTDPGHAHFLSAVSGQTSKPVLSPANYMATIANYGNDGNYILGGVTTPLPTVGLTSTIITGVTVATALVISDQGGGQAHSNVQPSFAVNWIIYIP